MAKYRKFNLNLTKCENFNLNLTSVKTYLNDLRIVWIIIISFLFFFWFFFFEVFNVCVCLCVKSKLFCLKFFKSELFILSKISQLSLIVFIFLLLIFVIELYFLDLYFFFFFFLHFRCINFLMAFKVRKILELQLFLQSANMVTGY